MKADLHCHAVILGKELGVHAGSFHDGIYWNSDRSIT